MRSCTGRGALGGAPVGAVVLLVAGAARPRLLMGQLMVRPSIAPCYEASCAGSFTPHENGFPLGDALQFAPRALQLHAPFFLPVEDAHFPIGPAHQGTARAL